MSKPPRDGDGETGLVPSAEAPLAQPGDELPVVARLVVEIRSDGSRTVARGAVVDHQTGQTVTIEAKGATPLSLATSLAKSMFTLPALAKTMAAGLLPGRRKKKR